MLKEYIIHGRKTFLLAYPVMLSQLGQVLVGVADSVMVGHIGKEPLAASSLGNSVFYLFFTFGLGISFGITPLVAKADGENNPRQIIELLKHGLLLNTATAFFLMVILFGTSYLFPYLNQPDEVVVLAIPYFLVISFSVLPFMIFQAFRQFAEGLSLTKQSMYITISGNIVNIVLNYLLIFGKFGFPELGLLGAGIATLISRIFMGIAMALFVIYGKRFSIYWSQFRRGTFYYAMLRRILYIGLPSGFQFIFEVGAFGMAAIMVGWIGTSALAAHQIALNLASITYMMAAGIASATTIRVGNQLGMKDYLTLQKVGFAGFMISGTFMGLSAIILILGMNVFPTFYIDEPEVLNIASGLILIAAIFQLSDGIQVVGLGALRGMSDVRIPTFITLLAYWILALPIGYLLGFVAKLGVYGIWIGLLIGLTVTAILLLLRFRILSAKRLKV